MANFRQSPLPRPSPRPAPDENRIAPRFAHFLDHSLRHRGAGPENADRRAHRKRFALIRDPQWRERDDLQCEKVAEELPGFVDGQCPIMSPRIPVIRGHHRLDGRPVAGRGALEQIQRVQFRLARRTPEQKQPNKPEHKKRGQCGQKP